MTTSFYNLPKWTDPRGGTKLMNMMRTPETELLT